MDSNAFKTYDELIVSGLQSGDIIEIDRKTYSHWALFAYKRGQQYLCFHVTRNQTPSDNIAVNIFNMFDTKAYIRGEPLSDILADSDDGQPSLARVNNKETEARVMNVSALNIGSVIARLENQRDYEIEFHLITKNSEHYVTEWKYGREWSRQSAMAVGAAAVCLPVIDRLKNFFPGF